MFCFAFIRVNAQSEFTFAGTAGELRLYVNPDELKQSRQPPWSTGAKSQHMSSSSALTVHRLENACPRNEHIVNIGVHGV